MPKHGISRYQHGCRCVICRSAKQKDNRNRNRGKKQDTFRKWRYGLTREQASALLKAQGNRCPICGQSISLAIGAPNPAHIDHDHVTRRVRGLLCQACNLGLGWFREAPGNLARAIEYLKISECMLGGQL